MEVHIESDGAVSSLHSGWRLVSHRAFPDSTSSYELTSGPSHGVELVHDVPRVALPTRARAIESI